MWLVLKDASDPFLCTALCSHFQCVFEDAGSVDKFEYAYVPYVSTSKAWMLSSVDTVAIAKNLMLSLSRSTSGIGSFWALSGLVEQGFNVDKVSCSLEKFTDIRL